jgi:DNA-binding response OmpR family regulator
MKMYEADKEWVPEATQMEFRDRPLHILLIEDDDAMREMLAESLRQEGWTVTECENGFRWLQFCVRESTEDTAGVDEDYDVIVSDIRVPGMSGLEAMETLQDLDCAGSCPPTILITAFGDEETHRRAKQLGAAIILDKPFAPKELIAGIRAIAVE